MIGDLNLGDPRSDFRKSPSSNRFSGSVNTSKSITNLLKPPPMLLSIGQKGALSHSDTMSVPVTLHALAW